MALFEQTAPSIHPLARIIAPLIAGLGALHHAHSQAQEIERLWALSDQQLAKRGLTRDGIAAHVFRQPG